MVGVVDGLVIDHSHVTFLAVSSHGVLPTLNDGRVLDVAVIDGALGFPFAIVDGHYLSPSLKVGGSMLVNDIAIPAIARLFKFVSGRGLHHPEVQNRRMDYSFASPSARAQLAARSAVFMARREAGHRQPWLREVYQRRVRRH
jgi:hypothetical protein